MNSPVPVQTKEPDCPYKNSMNSPVPVQTKEPACPYKNSMNAPVPWERWVAAAELRSWWTTPAAVLRHWHALLLLRTSLEAEISLCPGEAPAVVPRQQLPRTPHHDWLTHSVPWSADLELPSDWPAAAAVLTEPAAIIITINNTNNHNNKKY